MLDTRITSTGGGRLMLANLQTNYRKLVEVQGQVASGKALSKPSDNPAQVLNALDYRDRLRRSQQYERNSQDATGWITAADSAMTTVVDYVRRVRDLALQANNGGADTAARQAAADEMNAIRDSLIQLANTTYLGRPVFAGTANVTQAYDATGAYLGDTGTVVRNVAPNVSVQVNGVGSDVFGTEAGGPNYAGNLFERIDQLVADVVAGNSAAVATGIGALDSSFTSLQTVQATLGSRANQLERTRSRQEGVTLELTAGLSEVEDIDISKALVELKVQEMAYQAALSVTAKVVQPSLVDFLR